MARLFFICLYSSILLLKVFSLMHVKAENSLPTLYQYYTSDGIKSGLEAHQTGFTLNRKPIVLLGGSFHYFRAVPEYWSQLLLKYKAAGLNSVQIYIPWNLHEDQPNRYDFESPMLNLTDFIIKVQQHDMLLVIRPGPYICAEWENGGLPSWLLHDSSIETRTNNSGYMLAIKRYFKKLFLIINQYQFKKNGPVIAVQIENEYFPTAEALTDRGHDYMKHLRQMIIDTGFQELLFTSDPVGVAKHVPNKFLPNVLETANLNNNAYNELKTMHEKQKKAIYVSEFWPGWFDNWGESRHHTYSAEKFEKEVSDILFRLNGSVNFYMFFGGTNFGFTNGGDKITSYDYDAPLSESGNYTAKYWKTKQLHQKLVDSGRLPKLRSPEPPKVALSRAYGSIEIDSFMPLETMLTLVKPVFHLKKPVFMENLNFTEHFGQRFGLILYRVETKPITKYVIRGHLIGHFVLITKDIDKDHVEFKENVFRIKNNDSKTNEKRYYDVLVENTGRDNDGFKKHYFGLQGDVYLDQTKCTNFTIYPLQFERSWIKSLQTVNGWLPFNPHQAHKTTKPALFRATLTIQEDSPTDTFLKLPQWNRGLVFVNGFNLGRYNHVGPQQTLYVPGPLLRQGLNTILVFEQHQIGSNLQFLNEPILNSNH